MTADPTRRYRITADEFQQMGEAGVFSPDTRIELVEGELIDMPPIGTRHAATVEHLADLLRRAVGDRTMVRTQQPSILGRYSMPQPDITVVVRRDDYYSHAHPEPHDVLLVVEVAETTLAFDRDVKVAMYARSGVPEVWVVDIAGHLVTRSVLPRNGVYTDCQVVRAGEAISLNAFPEAIIDTHALFGE